MDRFIFVPFALAFLSLFTCPVSAATLYVDASVAQSGDGATWETAFQKIQEGIDAASASDTVTVAPGVYIENIHFAGKNVILTSTDPLDADIVAATIIDGNRAGSVATFDGTENESCILSGFTIRSGIAMAGGGICGGTPDSHTLATICNNNITANSGSGLAYCDGIIKNNTVTNNSAELGGGLVDCDGVIQGNHISYNRASSTAWSLGRGGGLARCHALIHDNTVSHNHADEGGGLYSCDSTIRNNAIMANWVWREGGGLADCDGLIQNNRIAENSASYGGGLFNCDGTIESNRITGNSGGGLFECDGLVQNNIVFRNATDKASRGGLHYCDGTIQNNVIAENRPGLQYCHGLIRGNTIVGNRASHDILSISGCNGTITNCVIWGNEGYDATQMKGSSQPTYSCIQDWTGGGEGNIAEDPRFADPDGRDNDASTYEDNDYRLLPDSPCIDAGFNHPDLPAKDIAGMRRIMYGGTSLTVDMGAYEYYINEIQPGPGTGAATLTWSSIADTTYVILYSEDLLIWILAEAGLPSAGNQTTSWIDDGMLTGVPPSLAPRRFYRILENP